VQKLSSDIKLRIHTALGMTIYPNIPPSQTWSKIAEGTPILIIAPTGGRLVSGLDCEDWTQGPEGHVTVVWESLGHLSQLGDATAEVEVDAGDLVRQWWTILHIYTHGRDNVAGTEGGQPPINRLRVACLNRCRSQHEGS